MSQTAENIPNQDDIRNAVIKFDINDQRIAEAREEFRDVDAYKDITKAKEAKRKLVKMRSSLTEAHKEAKADALAYGRLCDTEKNRLMLMISEIEVPITDQLDEIKNAAKIKEEARLAAIEAALDEIDALALGHQDLSLQALSERLKASQDITVTEEVFQEQTETAETHLELAVHKLTSSLKKAVERQKEIDDLAERKRLQDIEDEKLRKEREAFEAEKAAAEAEKREIERERKAKEDIERAKAQAQLDADRKVLEEQQRAQDEAERAIAKAKEKAEAEAKRLRLAPDHEKLKVFANQIAQFELPELESEEAKVVLMVFLDAMNMALKDLRQDVKSLAG